MNNQKQAALLVILDKEPSFLRQMDAIVFRFYAESLQRVQYLECIEWILTLATLVVLILEGVFVFRPVVNYTKQVIRMLSESEGQLKITNEKLADANRKLVMTQKKLLKTNEEKYQLQLAEEIVRTAALLEGQEEERKRFARELHDGIGQMLTGLKLHVEKLRQVPFENDKQRQRVEQLRSLLQDTIQNTRQVAYNLMPSVLSDFGLEAALKLMVEQTVSSSGMSIECRGAGAMVRLTTVQEIGLYRIAQEALNNAVKHSEATDIKVIMQLNSSGIILIVMDDGKGFDRRKMNKRSDHSQIHHGLENIRTRVRLLNGTLEIASKVNKGTKIEVKLLI
jgi:signal transduction histidine kinase